MKSKSTLDKIIFDILEAMKDEWNTDVKIGMKISLSIVQRHAKKPKLKKN